MVTATNPPVVALLSSDLNYQIQAQVKMDTDSLSCYKEETNNSTNFIIIYMLLRIIYKILMFRGRVSFKITCILDQNVVFFENEKELTSSNNKSLFTPPFI